MPDEEKMLTSIVNDLEEAARGNTRSTVSVGTLLTKLGHRGYGAALGVLPLVELSPIGGIPGFPTMLAIVLAVLTIRMLLGYENFWAPEWLRKREIDSSKVISSLEWLKPLSRRIDERLHERLARFAGQNARRVASCVILAMILTVPPLEIVPLASSVPMIVIAILGMGMLFNDGLIVLIGFLAAAVSAVAGLAFFI